MASTSNNAARVVMITGAGSGIGAAAARRFAAEGAAVALLGVPAAGLNNVAGEIEGSGGRALAIPADVSDAGAMTDAVATVVETFGRLDVCVASAGVQLHTRDREMHAMDDAAWDKTHDVNYRGVYLTCKAALAHMVAHGGGSITIIGSIAGLSGAAANPAYTAGKHGLIGLTRYIAVHYADRGVRCNIVCPGALERTPNHDEHPDPDGRAAGRLARIPLGRLGMPDDIAPWITFLASDAASYTTGATLVVDGGFSVT